MELHAGDVFGEATVCGLDYATIGDVVATSKCCEVLALSVRSPCIFVYPSSH